MCLNLIRGGKIGTAASFGRVLGAKEMPTDLTIERCQNRIELARKLLAHYGGGKIRLIERDEESKQSFDITQRLIDGLNEEIRTYEHVIERIGSMNDRG